MEFLLLCLICLFSFVSLFLIAKLMGHKQVSQLDFFDYITGITIGSIAAEFATNLEEPWKPLVAMSIYGTITVLLSIVARKFPRIRKYLNGTSSIIMNNGKLDQKNMKKAKLDLNEFLMMCREQGYFDLSSIQTAIFECDGKLSILPNSSRRPTTPEDFQLKPEQEPLFAEIIMDGRIMEKNLKHMGFDLNWLSIQLKQHKISSAEDVFLAVCDKNQNILFYKKENFSEEAQRL
ncbi:MAG: DUF421 domain-containing protein [Anaerovoracaceae bacterium]